MDLQTDTVTETVEKAEGRTVVLSGKKVVLLQHFVGNLMESSAGNADGDGGFGALSGFKYGGVGFADDLRSFAFDHGAGEVAPVTAGGGTGKNIHHNGSVGEKYAAAGVVRLGGISAAGADGAGGQCAAAEYGAVDFRTQNFTGKRGILPEKLLIFADSSLFQHLTGTGETGFTGSLGGGDSGTLGGGFELSFRQKAAFDGMQFDAAGTEFFRQQQGKGSRYIKGGDAQTFCRIDDDLAAGVAVIPFRHHQHSGGGLMAGTVDFQSGNQGINGGAVDDTEELIRQIQAGEITDFG